MARAALEPGRALDSQQVQRLVQLLQPQLDAIFPLPLPPSACAPSPPPEPCRSDNSGGRGSRAAGLDEHLQLARSKELKAAGDLLAAITGFKHTVSLIRKRERTQRNAAATAGAKDSPKALLPETYFLMGRCFEGEQLRLASAAVLV